MASMRALTSTAIFDLFPTYDLTTAYALSAFGIQPWGPGQSFASEKCTGDG